MSERELENGEEAIDESGRNLTQQEIDERGASEAPADADWEEVPPLADEDDGGTGPDDGGPGSQNM